MCFPLPFDSYTNRPKSLLAKFSASKVVGFQIKGIVDDDAKDQAIFVNAVSTKHRSCAYIAKRLEQFQAIIHKVILPGPVASR